MSTGMTLKQFARREFFCALDAYKTALRERREIVAASLRIHAALGREGVPKSWQRYVRSAFKET